HQRLHVADRTLPLAGVLPRGDVAEVLVVAERLAVGRLPLLAEVPAARLAALERVEAHQLAELQEVGHAAGLLERLVDLLVPSRPATRTSFQTSSRRAGISPTAFFRPASLRATPQYSHMILPSPRWNVATVRLPLIERNVFVRAATACSASWNAG